MQKQKFRVLDVCFIAVFVAIIAALAQVTVPLPLGVPLSLQSFAVALAGAVLGAKKGTIAVLVYLVLGAVGAPVFVGFGGGFHRIVGPWGGYLLSYPVFAFSAGFGADRERKLPLFLGLLIGTAINLTAGTAQLAIVNNYTWQAAVFAGMLPFIVGDLIKLGAVFGITQPLRKVMQKASARI